MPPDGVDWQEDGAALAALAPAWDAVAAADPMPYARTPWLLPWLAAFAGRRRVLLCTVWRGGELVAGIPLLAAGGRRLVAPVNDHTPHFRPVFRDDDALHELLAAVVGATRGTVRVAALSEGGRTAAALVGTAPQAGSRTLVEPQHVSPFVDLSSGEVGWRREAKSRLAEYERRRRKLRREHDVQLVTVDRPADLERHLERGLELEAAGWKGRAGSAILSSPVTTSFYLDVARRHDALGQLRVSALYVDGELAAFDLALLSDGRYHLLKTAYDERRRSLAPAMVLRLEVLDRCFALRLDRHEFLGPDMAWKRVFANGERRHCAVNVFAPTAAGAASGVYRAYARPLLRSLHRTARAHLGGTHG